MSPSQFLQALKVSDKRFVDKTILRKMAKVHKKSKDTSPEPLEDEEEQKRIDNDYIKEKYTKLIINKKSAREVMRSLLTNPKRGLTRDFQNILGGAGKDGRESFVNYLFEKYAQPKIDLINKSEIELKKGKRKGLKINNKVYLITTKKGIYARKFKTGLFTKMRKSYLNVF